MCGSNCNSNRKPRRKLKRDAANGKGSKRRQENTNTYRDNYDKIFGNKKNGKTK